MRKASTPNPSVWGQAMEYLSSAEILLKNEKSQPAVIMAALSIEVCLKSFLVRPEEIPVAEPLQDLDMRFKTDFGHNLVDLVKKINKDDIAALENQLQHTDKKLSLQEEVEQYDGIFTKFRYQYEPSSPPAVKANIIGFAKRLCDATKSIGEERGN